MIAGGCGALRKASSISSDERPFFTRNVVLASVVADETCAGGTCGRKALVVLPPHARVTQPGQTTHPLQTTCDSNRFIFRRAPSCRWPQNDAETGPEQCQGRAQRFHASLEEARRMAEN